MTYGSLLISRIIVDFTGGAETMSNSVECYRIWKRKHPDFPLTVSPNGQWFKKVRGRTIYFGQLSDRDSALNLWLEEKDYLIAGLPAPSCGGSLTAGNLCDKHAADLEDRIAAGTLSAGTGRNYFSLRNILAKAGLIHVPIRLLSPEHFTAVQRQLESSGYSLSTRKRMVTTIKTIFTWGQKMGLYNEAIRFGPRFTAPSLTAIEIEQEEVFASLIASLFSRPWKLQT
jgi:hypothetical protein